MFLRVGLNVAQYKKRASHPATRNAAISELTSKLRGEFRRVERRTGKKLSSYLLWTNLHLTTEQAVELRTAILECYPETVEAERPHVGVVGAAQLASMLNDLPHLRSAFFATEAFRDWGSMQEAHRRRSVPLANNMVPALVGRREEMTKLEAWIKDPNVRAVILTGPRGIGKHRLVIEATRYRDVDVVESLDPDPSPDEISRLSRVGRETIVVLENAGSDTAERLVYEAALCGSTKIVVTMTSREDAPLPGFGADDRVRILPVAPLAGVAARELLEVVAGKNRFDYALETWILEHAGGVPAVIVSAAAIGSALRPKAGTFAEQVGSEYIKRAGDRFSDSEISALAAASLLTHVRVEGDEHAEIRSLCRVVGIEANTFLNAIDRFQDAGLIRRVGSYLETIPPAMANVLAGRAIRGRPAELALVFEELGPSGRTWLLRRLALIRPENAAPFWSLLFGPGGRLGTLAAVLRHAKLFAAAAAAALPRAAEIVRHGLESRRVAKRRRIAGRRRRSLISALEDLLASEQSGEDALRSLALLAEVENEQIGNNATGVFEAALAPLHSQVPVPLDRRLSLVQEFANPNRSEAAALLAIGGAAAAIEESRWGLLRPSRGARPGGGWPSGLTWAQVWSYRRGMLELLLQLTRDSRDAVRQRAKREAPRLCQRFALTNGPEGPVIACQHFRWMVDQVLAGDIEYAPHDLADAIASCWRALVGMPDDHRFADSELRAAELAGMFKQLSSGPFDVRARLLLGGWTTDLELEAELRAVSGRAAEGRTWTTLDATGKLISDLAEEACSAPEKLDETLIEWMASTDVPRAGHFWAEIGRYDVDGKWRTRALLFARLQSAAHLFLAYLSFMARRDRKGALRLLDELSSDPAALPMAVAAASFAIEDPAAGAARLRSLVERGQLEARQAAKILLDRTWLKTAPSSAFLTVAEIVVGPRFENSGLIIQPLSYWFDVRDTADDSAVVDFAWRCLQSAPVVEDRANGSFYADDLAGRLAEHDPERGFDLLDCGLRWMDDAGQNDPAEIPSEATANEKPAEDDGPVTSSIVAAIRRRFEARSVSPWNPIERHGSQRFWKALRQADRARALTCLLDAMSRGGASSWRVAWHIQDLLEMPNDAGLLRSYAERGDAEAEAVAAAISSRHPGFWELACCLVEGHPGNEMIQSHLTAGIAQMGSVISGRMSDHYAACLREIEQAKQMMTVGMPRASAWLDRVASSFRQAAETERRGEEDATIEW